MPWRAAARLCKHALVEEQGPCQRVRGLRARGKPLVHHERKEARRGDEAHHAMGPLPTGGHLRQWICKAREETTNVNDGAPPPGLAMRESRAVAVRGTRRPVRVSPVEPYLTLG